MYDRIFTPIRAQSYFLLGPRGTGKSSWLRKTYPEAPYFDLLDDAVLFDLQRDHKVLQSRIPKNYTGAVVIDEIQKLPALLDEIHRLIESNKKLKFVMTGSSARKLKREGANLLAGRALDEKFYPLSAIELGEDFNLKQALKFGMLPMIWSHTSPAAYLKSYIHNYVDQEVKLEGLSRNIPQFNRFLQAASFSQGQPLNISNVSADCGIERRTVTNFFEVLEDLLIAHRIPVFARKSKRDLATHNKFYFFDTGVFQTLRPRGPLDSDSEILGVALESLVLQHLTAYNRLFRADFDICYWHTRKHLEVDFVLYGPKGFYAIEVKAVSRVRKGDTGALLEFKKDYKDAELLFVYGGDREFLQDDIKFVPALDFFKNAHKLFTDKT